MTIKKIYNEKIRIFAGSASKDFAKELAKEVWIELSPLTIKQFSCGETYVKLDKSVRWKKVFIVQTTRTWKMNEDFMELFLLINAAKKSFAKTVHIIIPYISYSRQDKIHEPREPISAKLISQLIEASWADEVITMHLHADQHQAFFDIPVDNLNPMKLFIEEIRSKNLKNPVIISPDAGWAKNAKKFADELWYPLAIMHKTRPEHNVSEITHIIWDIKWKTPIIYDDIVDTAWSVCGAKKALVKNWANNEVYMVATHPVFSGPAVERLDEAWFKEIIVSNSIPLEWKKPKNIKQISIAPLIAKVVKNIIDEKWITEIYR